MGGGKTTAMANMLNYDPAYKDKKVVYIAPFLSECERFAKACNRPFVEPKAWDKYGGTKLSHTTMLLSEGKSISTTHAAFMRYDENILSLIRNDDWVLIMDETCNVMEDFEWNGEDMWLLEKADVVSRDGSLYRFNEDEAHYIEGNGTLSNLCKKMRYMDLHRYSESNSKKYFYYTMPPAVLKSFSEIFVLTYMWTASDLYHMMEAMGMKWEYWYVRRVNYGNTYMITDKKPDIPDFVTKIPDLIDVYDRSATSMQPGHPRKDLNVWKSKLKGFYGNDRYPFKLSMTFFKNDKNKPIITQLRNNIRSYFRNVMMDYNGSRDECIWSTYKDYKDDLYSKANQWLEDRFVPFNERAKNDYADCRFIAYAVDIHPNPMKVLYYEKHGFSYPEDEVALSTMVQFLWRGRIRKQEDIHVYIPSKRMRDLLNDWLNDLREGRSWCEI